jgi:hypothetical protein
LADITQIVVHHTSTGATLTPQRLAQYLVDTLDKPGILYHFFVAADGKIYQTNRLDTAPDHAQQRSLSSVGVCFPGNFTTNIPTAAQLRAGGRLCAWLLDLFFLPAECIVGVSEFASTQSPPAMLNGRWKDSCWPWEAAGAGGEDAPASPPPDQAQSAALHDQSQQPGSEPPSASPEPSPEELAGPFSEAVLPLQSPARPPDEEPDQTQALPAAIADVAVPAAETENLEEMEGALGEDAEAHRDWFAGSPAELQRLAPALPAPSAGTGRCHWPSSHTHPGSSTSWYGT